MKRSPSPKQKKHRGRSLKRANSEEEKLLRSLNLSGGSEVELLKLLGAPKSFQSKAIKKSPSPTRSRRKSPSPKRERPQRKRSPSPKLKRNRGRSPVKSEEEKLLRSLDLAGGADILKTLEASSSAQAQMQDLDRKRSTSLKKRRNRNQSPKRVKFEEDIRSKTRSPSPKAKRKDSKKGPQSSKGPKSVEEKLLKSFKLAGVSEVELLELLGAPKAMKKRARKRSQSPQRIQTDEKRSRSPKVEGRKRSASPYRLDSEVN